MTTNFKFTNEVLHHLPVLLTLSNREGQFVDISNAWCQYLGLTKEEILKQQLFDYLHPDDYESCLQAYEYIKEHNVLENFSHRIIIKSQIKHLRWNGYWSEENQLFISIATDITAEMQMMELHNSAERNVRMGSWAYDLVLNKPIWSPQTYAIHELDLDTDFDLNDAINFYHPEDRNLVQQKLKELGEEHKPYTFRARLITAKGNERVVRSTGDVELVGGKPHRFFGTIADITHEYQTEVKLRDSLLYSKALISAVPDVIIRLHKDGTYLDVQTRNFEQLSVRTDRLVGRNIRDVFTAPDLYKKYNDCLQLAINTGRLIKLEYMLPDEETGEEKYFETRISKLTSEEAIAIVRNISERVAEQKKLEERERYLSSLVNSQASYIVRTDIEGNYTFVNRSFMEKFGYTESLIGKPSLPTICEHDHHKCMEAVMNCLSNPGKQFVVQLEKPIVGSTDTVYTEWEFSTVNSEKGEVIEIQCIGKDITVLNKVQRELEFFTLVGQETTNTVIITDEEGKAIWLNKTFEKLTEYKVEEVMGKKPGDLLQGEKTDKNIVRKISQAIKSKQPFTSRLLNYTKSGKPYWVELNIKPFNNPISQTTGFIGTQRDITRQVAYEESLKRKNAELKKINHELDNFVYRVSHDLRAPLASAIGLVELSKVEKNQEDLQMLIQLQGETLGRLDGFIADILDYSRNSRAEVNAHSIQLEELMIQTYEDLMYFNKLNFVHPKFFVNQDVDFFSDELRLKVIFKNLISNAIKYYDPNKSTPELSVQANVDEQEAVVVFSDNGVGIHSSYLPKVFDMFYRASESSQGSGLGLYIVKEAVQKLNGTISIESELGSGTQITLKLPNLKKIKN